MKGRVAVIGAGIIDTLETIMKEQNIQNVMLINAEPERSCYHHELGPSFSEMRVTEALDYHKNHPMKEGQKKYRVGGNNRKKKKGRRK